MRHTLINRASQHILLLASLTTLSVAIIACSDSLQDPKENFATPDEDASTDEDDADERDASARDAKSPKDAGPGASADAGDILGTLSGSCGNVRLALSSKSASLEVDNLVFVTGEKYEKGSLSAGGQRLFDTPNAGGSSTESEVMSYEVLRACEGAKLLKTETEVLYGPPPDGGASTITDILVEIDGQRVGVSVTRAYKPKSQGAQTEAEIKSLLEKKLEGVNSSTARVAASDKWVKQVLHVFSATTASTDAIKKVFPTISAAVRADTIVLVTETAGGGFIYCNPDPPLGSECN